MSESELKRWALYMPPGWDGLTYHPEALPSGSHWGPRKGVELQRAYVRSNRVTAIICAPSAFGLMSGLWSLAPAPLITPGHGAYLQGAAWTLITCAVGLIVWMLGSGLRDWVRDV